MTARDVLASHAAGLADEVQERVPLWSPALMQDEVDALTHQARFGLPQSTGQRLELTVLVFGEENLHARHRHSGLQCVWRDHRYTPQRGSQDLDTGANP